MLFKLLAAGLVLTSGANAVTTPYGGRRGEQTITRPYTDEEWIQKKLHKLEQQAKRDANADWRKDERKEFREHLETTGDWADVLNKKTAAMRDQEILDREAARKVFYDAKAAQNEANRAAKAGDKADTRADKMGPDSGWGANKEDSMEYTEAEARMSRRDRNAAYRTRKRNADAADEVAAAAASTWCKDETRNKLKKCLELEILANNDQCDQADNKRNQLVCLLWRQDL